MAAVPQHYLRMKTVTHSDLDKRNQTYITELHFRLIYKMETTAVGYFIIIQQKAFMHMQNKGCTNILQKRYRMQLQYLFLHIINSPK